MPKSPAFEDIFDGFIDLYGQNQPDEALALLRAQAANYPEWDALMRFWEISLCARGTDGQAALEKLGQALDAGLWYHEDALTNDPDLQALAELPAYQALVARSAALRQTAEALASPRMELERPGQASPWPALTVFHGNNSSIAATRGAWQEACRAGWLLALPQSSRLSWLSNHYNWNFPEAVDQAGAQISALLASEPVQAGRVLTGGFSMGAALALRLGLEGKQPIDGVIAIEPWLPDPATWPALIKECPLPGPKFYLVGGPENSEYFTSLQWLETLLRTAGFEVTLIEATNPLHRLPDEFDQILAGILSKF